MKHVHLIILARVLLGVTDLRVSMSSDEYLFFLIFVMFLGTASAYFLRDNYFLRKWVVIFYSL